MLGVIELNGYDRGLLVWTDARTRKHTQPNIHARMKPKITTKAHLAKQVLFIIQEGNAQL